jgi:FkbM family methyltransferase
MAIFRPLTYRITYTIHSGIAAGLKRSGGFGFVPHRLCDEERFYQSLNLVGKTFYDVGSYDGIMSLFAARAVGPSGRLVVCEPNPECFRRTTRNLSLNQFECQIILENLALGETSGEFDMFCPTAQPALATLNAEVEDNIRKAGEPGVTCRVKVEKLDNLIDKGLPVPDFIKIDTEGSELGVLKGSVETLKAHSPELFIELHGTTHESWVRNRRAIHELLEPLGYRIFNMYRQPVLDDNVGVSHFYCQKLA